jgi:hypothetical protein
MKTFLSKLNALFTGANLALYITPVGSSFNLLCGVFGLAILVITD